MITLALSNTPPGTQYTPTLALSGQVTLLLSAPPYPLFLLLLSSLD
jgi:hypothetical protein